MDSSLESVPGVQERVAIELPFASKSSETGAEVIRSHIVGSSSEKDELVEQGDADSSPGIESLSLSVLSEDQLTEDVDTDSSSGIESSLCVLFGVDGRVDATSFWS